MRERDAAVVAAVRGLFSRTATHEDLGKLLKFSMSTPPTGKRVFTLIFLLCLNVIFGFVPFNSDGDLIVLAVSTVGAGILLWLLVGVVLALFKGCKTFIGIYEKGFIYQRGADELTVVSWTKMRAITQAALHVGAQGPQGHTYVAIVLDSEQGKTTLNEEFPDIFEISEILDSKVCEALLPGAVSKLRAGKRVEFGDVSLDGDGIHRGMDNHLPWDKVGHVYIHNGKMRIMRKDTSKVWKKVRMQRVRNASLFVHLVGLATNNAG